jgi:heptosyltransferase-2
VPPNILIVRFSAIGDLLLITPLLRALRRRHPDARITLVTRASLAPLFAHNPRLTEVIGWTPGESLRALGRRLRGAGFTHRLDLHGSLRSRTLRWHIGGRWTSYPKQRTARALLIRTKRNLYRDRRPVAERYFDAALDLDVRPDEGSLELFLPRPALEAADAFLRTAAIGSSRQLIALAPGAAHFTKRWPAHHWIALTRRLVEQGNDVVVLGGPADREIAAQVAAAGGAGAVSAAGAFDLLGSGALLKRARALVSGDTGVMHLATAIGTPVVALFGPTVEAFGFFPYHAKAAVLQIDLPCRPCLSADPSPLPAGPPARRRPGGAAEAAEMTTSTGASGALIRVMGDMPRGPKREGAFALWLTVRVAEDMLLTPPQPERAVKRRVQALEQRLSSLTLPAPLRRALTAAIGGLREPGRDRAAQVLHQLTAPVREVLGGDASEVIARAARAAAVRAREE